MEIKKLKIQILVNDIAGFRKTLGEAGFCALIDVFLADDNHKQILFDTGPSELALLNNIEYLKVDLSQIDTIVLSHGHWDHTGGLKALLDRLNYPILICHPQALESKILKQKTDEGIKEYEIGLPGEISLDILNEKAKVLAIRQPYELIGELVMTTGQIPRRNDFEEISGRLKKVKTFKNSRKIPDMIEDDLSLIVQLEDNSLVILTGCCHAGIINTIDKVKEITGSSKIFAIIGGLHLHDASDKRLKKTIEALTPYSTLSHLSPMHCTGLKGMISLQHAFPRYFKPGVVGSEFIFKKGR
jgi:7,8-dihydropterin-6-yl-methyl-4-(beta-D-ribofuranosyl)aminobenzene 5'-phosphate synthase